MAVRIDATTDQIGRTTSLIDFNAAYTWMGWCYFTSLPTTRASTPFLMQTNAGGANSSDYIQIDSSATHHMEWGNSVSNSFTSRTGTTAIVTATWYHLTIVRTSSTALQGFLNGVAEGAGLTTNVGTRAANAAMQMGGYDTASDWMDGRIAYVKAWTRALTAAEILNEMRVIHPLDTTSLHGFWPLWPNERTKDLSGNGRTLTEAGTLTDEDPPPISYGSKSNWITIVPAGGGGTTTPQTLTGAVTSSATIVKLASAHATATATASGTIVKFLTKPLSGLLFINGQPGGSLPRIIIKSFAATITSSGAFASAKFAVAAMAGAIDSAGTLAQRTQKQLVGSIALAAASIGIKTFNNLASILTSSATVTKRIAKSMAGAITSSATINNRSSVSIFLAGVITSNSTIARQVYNNLSSSVSSTAEIGRFIYQNIASTLTIDGLVSKISSRSFAGVISSITSTVSNVLQQFASTAFSTATYVADDSSTTVYKSQDTVS